MIEPLSTGERRDVIERYARLLSVVGAELGERPLVLPTARYFPDRFTRDADSAGTLVTRMLEHAGMEDVPVSARVVFEDGPEAPHPGGCATGCQVPAAVAGSIPRLVDDGAGWVLSIPEFELAHPVVLTTMVARALGHVFLAEVLPDGTRPEEPVALTADYAAVGLGFGALLLEGAYIYSKGCGGPQVASVTTAGISELALATALFAEMHGHGVSPAARELGATQAEALRDAHAFVGGQSGLGRALRATPELVAAGGFVPAEKSSFLSRVLRKGSGPEAPAPRKEAKPDAERDALRALVDEVLAEPRAEAE